MGWQSADAQPLPEVVGQAYTKKEVIIDGNSFQKCTFNDCRLIYRGGLTMFTDAAAYVLQTLQELGWTIAPPGHVDQIHPPSRER